MGGIYSEIALWVVLFLSATAIIAGGCFAARVRSRKGGVPGGRLHCPAIRDGLMLLLAVQILVHVVLAMDSVEMVAVWELPAALLLATLAWCLIGRTLCTGRRGLAFYWWGVRRAVVRYSDIETIRVDCTQQTEGGRWIPSRLVLVGVDGVDRNVTGYENLFALAKICKDNGVAVALDEIHRVARLRWAMWGLLLFVVLTLLLINALWAAGLIDVAVNVRPLDWLSS